jgi:hypothetical protein
VTDAAGKETILRPPLKERITGVPGVWTFNAQIVRGISLDLLRLIGERSLPEGRCSIRAFYENTLPNNGPFIQGPVWTGRIESRPVEIEIVLPGPFKRPGPSGTRP